MSHSSRYIRSDVFCVLFCKENPMLICMRAKLCVRTSGLFNAIRKHDQISNHTLETFPSNYEYFQATLQKKKLLIIISARE